MPRDCREEWYDIPGYEGNYQLSNKDRVKSLPRKARIRGGAFKPLPEKIKRPSAHPSGYIVYNLWKNGKGRVLGIHQLKLMTFVGPCPNGMEACHNDGDTSNNSLSNLRWDTRENNARDKVRHNTSSKGVIGNTHKLGTRGEGTKRVMELWLSGNYSRLEIASVLRITPTSVCYHIKKGQANKVLAN